MVPRNRSAPPYGIIPVVAYEDVRAAVHWLTDVFGFAERVQIGDHRSQLETGGGAVIVADSSHGRGAPGGEAITHSVMVRVADIDAHHRHARAAGAQVLGEPVDQPFGERQYSVRDPAGHLWTFTQSVADVPPEEWGGVSVAPWQT